MEDKEPTLQDVMRALEGVRTEVRLDLTKLGGRLNEVEREVRSDVGKVDTRILSMSNRIDRLDAGLTEVKKEVRDVKIGFDATNKRLKDVSTGLVDVKEEVASLATTIHELDVDLDGHMLAHKEIDERLDELEEKSHVHIWHAARVKKARRQ